MVRSSNPGNIKKFQFHVPTILFICASILFSCSHEPKTVLPIDLRRIYISMFANDTDQSDLPAAVTTAVFNEFALDGRLIPVTVKNGADAILAAKILTYQLQPLSYTDSGDIDLTYMKIKIKFVVQDSRDGSILHNTEIEDSINFYRKTMPIETEMDAKKRLIDRIAKSLVKKIIEGF